MLLKTTVAAMCLAAAAAFIPVTPAFAAPSQTVTIQAKNFAFTPAVVTLKEGQSAHLTFVATQGVHGITVPEIGLNKTITVTSTPTTVTVTPQKTGTFVAHCAIFCGAGHAHMQITFKVVK